MRVLAPLTVLLTLALAAPALAGGWAVTTLDSVPTDMQAGQTYSIGFTIRQHGVTPVDLADVSLTLTSPDGAKNVTVPAAREGATGHYLAKVTFPYDGVWSWSVNQDWFGPYSLGKIQILAAAGAQPATNAAQAAAAQAAQQGAPAQPAPAAPNALLITALLLAISGAAILFGSRLAAFTSRRATA